MRYEEKVQSGKELTENATFWEGLNHMEIFKRERQFLFRESHVTSMQNSHASLPPHLTKDALRGGGIFHPILDSSYVDEVGGIYLDFWACDDFHEMSPRDSASF